MSARWIELEGMHNVRDLGGVPIPGGSTSFGVVLRGETVVHLTAHGATQLRELGVGHVLDLREPDEAALDGNGPFEAAYASRQVNHERVPLAHADIAQDPIGRDPGADAVAGGYARYLHNGGFRLADALARLAWSPSAMYVHCAVGKDRTGVVCALLLKLAGATDDAVIEDYLLTAQRLRPVLIRLGTRPAYAHLATPDWAAQEPSGEAMASFLAHLAAKGGAGSWLLDHGVDPATLDLLRGRLRGEGARSVEVAS
jgi:protein-tyrosine phosphatase